jgi:O-methyltransferase involved in polyketide biosynthesis
VERTLQQIAALGGSGTQLVFDYLLAEVLDGTTRNREALHKAQRVARLGEPWLFGLAPSQVRDYLASGGFTLLNDYEAAELRARYCPARQMPMNYIRIVVCERA